MGTTHRILEPATGEEIAAVPEADAADVDRAVAAARAAFDDGAWRSSTADRARALLDLAASIRDLLVGPEIQSLDLGLALTTAFTLVNLLLGRHLVRVGERTRSMALVADGRHILTDVWSSAGVIGGLFVVRLTGWLWADPAVAIVLALNVVREGYLLLRSAVNGLMDQVDDESLDHVVEVLGRLRGEELIDAHSLRSWRSGARPT